MVSYHQSYHSEYRYCLELSLIYYYYNMHPNELSPVFPELCRALNTECTTIQNGGLEALLDSIGNHGNKYLSLVTRTSYLSMRFQSLVGTAFNCDITDLQNFYKRQSMILDTSRYDDIASVIDNTYLMNYVHTYYDGQHHALLDRVEQSLNLLDQIQ